MLHLKSECMAAIFTNLKSLNESLANVGVHVRPLHEVILTLKTYHSVILAKAGIHLSG